MEHSDFDINTVLVNNYPQDDYSGLTHNERYTLLHDTFGEKSPVQFRSDITNAALDRIPFFRIAEEFLKLIQREGRLKLTPLGALPKKVLVELYEHKFILEDMIESGYFKLWKEENCISIMCVKFAVVISGLVKKSKGHLYLTKKGLDYLQPENRAELFKTIFLAYTTKFNWCYNDGYTDSPIAQFGFAYSIYLLDRYGHKEQKAVFYADRYLKAFPNSMVFFWDDTYSSIESQFRGCYILRTFTRFLEWFGFVIVQLEKKYWEQENSKIERTDLLHLVFIFD